MELSRHSRHPIHVVSGKERRDHTNLFQLIQLGFDQHANQRDTSDSTFLLRCLDLY